MCIRDSGYIVAGLLAGPSITQIPTVTNVESIRIWADIGVIFLLFALGLDFSFKKLMKVGGTAVIGAITIVIGMMTLGYTTGLSLGCLLYTSHMQIHFIRMQQIGNRLDLLDRINRPQLGNL